MNYSVLIVDDSPINRMALNRIFTNHNVTCIEASNGKEAIDAVFTHNNIGLILLDLNMPVMDGYEFIRWYAMTEYKTPVYIVSGSYENTFYKTTEECGIDTNKVVGFMTKPIDITELNKLYDKYLK
jgi:CheY-like chemotaxis protein